MIFEVTKTSLGYTGNGMVFPKHCPSTFGFLATATDATEIFNRLRYQKNQRPYMPVNNSQRREKSEEKKRKFFEKERFIIVLYEKNKQGRTEGKELPVFIDQREKFELD